MALQAALPVAWFGGKARVAPEVWTALGDVGNYIEPFAGSLGVLLNRPHEPRIETVDDADGWIVNFWRAVQQAPDDVADHAIWPVTEIDLLARHRWLCERDRKTEFLRRMEADPDYFDAQIAGWWVWGICAWIGSGWCAGWWDGEHGTGRGIERLKLPHLGNTGQGVNRQLPHLGNTGQVVNRQLPHLGDAGRGVNRPMDPNGTREYIHALAARLRRVRVCCGDWSRIVTDGAMAYGSTIGVFLDPPYDQDIREAALYSVDEKGISKRVAEWAFAHGDDPRLRIVLCGYEGEHEVPSTWRTIAYSAGRAYGRHDSETPNCENRHKERLWLSPGCGEPIGQTIDLFGGGW
ncbi:MAG: DNA adenine methylase [Planctomycetota bacterium]